MSQTLTVNLSGVITTSDSYAYSTASNTSYAYTDIDNNTYCRIAMKYGSGAASFRYFTFNLSALPEDANIVSVSARFKAYSSSTNSSYIKDATAQLTTGTTKKGSAVSFFSTTNNIYTFTNTGTWTRDELLNARFYIEAHRGTQKTTSSLYLYIYAAELTVTYNVAPQYILYTKNGNNWTPVTKAYKKISGVWVEETDLTQVFDNNNQYIKGNIS